MSWHHLKKQKPEPGPSDLENTSPRAQSTVGPYLAKMVEKGYSVKKQINQVVKEEKGTNQHLSFSNQISASEAASDSNA
jgi:hypothetical protein